MSSLSSILKKQRILKKRIEHIAVIGAGSWGTSLSLLLGKQGYPVRLWGYRPEHVELIRQNGENNRYLPGFSLPPTVTATADLKKALAGAGVICMVVPSHGYRLVFEKVLASSAQDGVFVSATPTIPFQTLIAVAICLVIRGSKAAAA